MTGLFEAQTLIPLLFSALAFVTVIGLALPFIAKDQVQERIKLLGERREELRRQMRERFEQKKRNVRELQTGRVGLMKAVINKLNLNAMLEQPKLKQKLLQAGWRGQAPKITFTFLRLALPIAFAGAAFLLLFGSSKFEMPTLLKFAIAAAAALFGYGLPNLMVSNAAAKRRQEFLATFPDALDLMVICIESGMSLEAAMAKVSEEMAADAAILSQEFGFVAAELAYLGDRRKALENLSERTGLPAVKSFVTSLIQAEKYGTPLGVSLRVVSQENRDSRMARAEEKAASLPAKLTVPMILFFLPVIFIVILGPTIIQAMKSFE